MEISDVLLYPHGGAERGVILRPSGADRREFLGRRSRIILVPFPFAEQTNGPEDNSDAGGKMNS